MIAEGIEQQDQAPYVHRREDRNVADGVPDTDLNLEDLNLAEVYREASETIEVDIPRDANPWGRRRH